MRNCASHPGDPVASLNDVSQQGWKMIPQKELMAKLPPVAVPGLKLDWYHMWLGGQAGRSLALLAGRGTMVLSAGRPAVAVGFCMAMQKPLDAASLEAAGSWTGVQPALDGPEGKAYLFAETAAGKRATTLTGMYDDFQAHTGRDVMTINHPNDQTSAIGMIAAISGSTK
jgi:hypothetical protein